MMIMYRTEGGILALYRGGLVPTVAGVLAPYVSLISGVKGTVLIKASRWA